MAAAELQFRKAIAIQADHHPVYEALGKVLKRQGKPAEAIAEYRKAEKIDPTCGHVHRFIADAMASQGKPEDAITEYRKAFRLRPTDVNSLFEFEQLLKKRGRPEDVLAEFRELTRLNPEVVEPQNALAWNLVVPRNRPRQDYEEALNHARTAVKLAPNDAEYINTLALAEYRVGHWNDSIAAANRSIELRKGRRALRLVLLGDGPLADWPEGRGP